MPVSATTVHPGATQAFGFVGTSPFRAHFFPAFAICISLPLMCVVWLCSGPPILLAAAMCMCVWVSFATVVPILVKRNYLTFSFVLAVLADDVCGLRFTLVCRPFACSLRIWRLGLPRTIAARCFLILFVVSHRIFDFPLNGNICIADESRPG